jgi:hypothetical protein
MTTQHVLMNLTMVLDPPNICNTKRDFYGGKHLLEVDNMHFYSALMASPPDPLSAEGFQESDRSIAERGKEIEKGGSLSEPPFSKRHPLPCYRG